LAKFEHAWLGMPDLVCFGAEKNFNRYAEWLAENGEPPAIDQDYFKQLVAKAILFKTTEKLFSAQELVGYRANSVAYAVAWADVHSDWRIDLGRIWEEQRVSPALCEVLRIAAAAAHAHITTQDGNPGEASKRDSCWKSFKERELAIDGAWRNELSPTRFLPANSEEEVLARQWEIVRHRLIDDSRTIGEVEAVTGKTWVATRRSDQVQQYAMRSWEELRALRGVGFKKLRGLVELLSAAAGA
jgi:hypothetical protein